MIWMKEVLTWNRPITGYFALVWVMAKSFAESKFRGSDYTMERSVSTKNMLLHL